MFRAAKNEHWRNMYMSELNLKLVYNAMDNVTASRIAQELDGRGIPYMVKDAADAEFMNIIAGSSQFCLQFYVNEFDLGEAEAVINEIIGN